MFEKKHIANALSLINEIHIKSLVLDGIKIKNGNLVKLFTNRLYAVDFICVNPKKYDILLGSIVVKLSDLTIDGIFYDQFNGYNHIIRMNSNTPQESVDKMISCIATAADLTVRSEAKRSISLPLRDCRA